MHWYQGDEQHTQNYHCSVHAYCVITSWDFPFCIFVNLQTLNIKSEHFSLGHLSSLAVTLNIAFAPSRFDVYIFYREEIKSHIRRGESTAMFQGLVVSRCSFGDLPARPEFFPDDNSYQRCRPKWGEFPGSISNWPVSSDGEGGCLSKHSQHVGDTMQWWDLLCGLLGNFCRCPQHSLSD